MKRKRLIKQTIYHIFVIAIGLAMIYPVLWMISGGFKTNQEILNGAFGLLPENWNFDNFLNGWKGFGGVTFATFFKNSFIISGIATVATVLSSACVAYSFSRLRYRGRKLLFTAMLCTMMLPGQIILIPQYVIYNKLGFVGGILPLILPHFFGQAFFIYQMMQFMEGIPKSLDEAAIIDGCSKYTTFTKIILPLIKPSIITTIIIQFYWKWDDFQGALVYLSKPATYTVSLALKLFADAGSTTDYGAMFAMSTLSLVPVFIIFLFFNRYLVEGISSSGIKG
ncbi:MAG: carbohydrate ABC transporter permease [Lachnospiraceae bacterium]